MPEWKVPGYTELKALGSGGFGEVVLARHEASGHLVAIKYLRRTLLDDPEFTEMFRAEARVLASLDDPNVVRLYEYVESPSGAAIVMELVDGVSLREILSQQGETTAEAALVVLQGSLLGLAAAHARGVVHRDYKPENVLVNGDGVSKLTDFGIAARAGDRPVAAGTLAYAPPEQFGSGPVSPAGDVYAATATFYECLAGHPPFAGDTAEALLAQHLSEPVPLDPVPEGLRPLVVAGMAKDPADRPADAAAFVTELRTAAGSEYGQDWEDRGRSRLGEAALLLAALWPSGTTPAVQGHVVEHVHLSRHVPESRDPGHAEHVGQSPATHPGPGTEPADATVGTGTGTAATNAAGAIPPPAGSPPVTGLHRLGSLGRGALSAGHGAGAAVAIAVVVGLIIGIVVASSGGGSTPSANSGPIAASVSAPAPAPDAAPDPAADPAPDAAPDPAADPGPSAQCVFSTNNGDCTSSDPEITLEEINNGDTSGCTFSIQVTWGDGSQQTVQYAGADGVPSFVASHTYQQAGTFTVSDSPTVLSGGCNATGDSYTFTYS
jgi:serine/threonine protein kinase